MLHKILSPLLSTQLGIIGNHLFLMIMRMTNNLLRTRNPAPVRWARQPTRRRGRSKIAPLSVRCQSAPAGADILSEIVQDVGAKSVSVFPQLIAAAKGGAWQQSLVETAGALTLNQMALALLPLVAASLISKLARSSANLWARLLDAGVLSPLKEMLPLLLFARVLTIWFASLSIVLQRLRPVRADLDRPTLACSDSLTRATLLLRQVIFGYNAIGNVSFSFAQALEATYESLWIVLAVRIVLSVKDIVLSEYANGTMEGKRENNSIGFMRFVESVKWFLSLVGWAVGVFNILVGAWGFNVVPLLSSLTASSLIIGLAAQPLLANALAGLAVFSSRQVVPGDHIQLLTAAGGVAIDGFVEVIGPTTTIIRDREDSLVYINNKSMSEMIVRNLSQTVVASK